MYLLNMRRHFHCCLCPKEQQFCKLFCASKTLLREHLLFILQLKILDVIAWGRQNSVVIWYFKFHATAILRKSISRCLHLLMSSDFLFKRSLWLIFLIIQDPDLILSLYFIMFGHFTTLWNKGLNKCSKRNKKFFSLTQKDSLGPGDSKNA